MLPWDGSQINFKEYFIEEGVYDKNTYWLLRQGEYENFCIVKSCVNNCPCLIDELKPVFNIEKNGTHWGKLGTKTMILLKVKVENGEVIEDLTLDELEYKSQIAHEIHKIFAFRELLGLSKSWEKSIVLRKIGHFVKPISFYEPNMNPNGGTRIIPQKVLEKWFVNVDIDNVIKKMFHINKIEEITLLKHELRGKMIEVFNRVDKNSITFLDEIIARIASHLQFSCE